ncbi:MAG: hypothetical protein V4726_08855 [Verrucomicrobiota bacterium]
MPSDFSNFQPGNPFLPDLAPEGPMSEGDSAPLHPGALDDLEEMLAVAQNQPPAAVGGGGGQVVMLRAPQAGFGKSHLLSWLRGRMETETFVVPVSFDPEGGIGWRSALHQALSHWHLPVDGGRCTTIDLIARRVFSLMNADLIRTGKVPCAQPAHAVASLARDYVAMFDFADRNQPVGQWFQDNFEPLMAASLPYLNELTALPEMMIQTWLRALCGYSQGGAEEDPQRLEALHWALRQPTPADGPGQPHGGGLQFFTAVAEGENFYRRMVTALCRLAAAGRPLVVILDHFDGFYNSPDDLLRLGRLISDWRRLSGRTVLVLSVNEDLWAGTFQKALPGVQEDRLTGWEVSPGGISLEEASALIRARLESAQVPPAVARGFAASLNLQSLLPGQPSPQGGEGLLSPRAVLRHAARCWQEYWKPAEAAPAAAVPYQPAAVTASTAVSAGSVRKEPFPLPLPPAPELPALSTAVPAVWPWEDPSPAPVPAVPPSGARPPGLRQPADPHNPGPHGGPYAPFSSGPPASARPPAHPAGPQPQRQPAPSAPQHWPGPLPASPPAPVPAPPPASVLSPEHTLSGRFQRLRAHFSSAPMLALDHGRLHRLIRWSGQRLAVVRYAEATLPGPAGRKVAGWQSPDGEILFGTEPHQDHAYWTALLEFARHRNSHMPGSRLVVFSAAAAPVNPAAWLHPDEIPSARTRFLNLQTLDHPSLATLYAAAEVLHESERGTLSAGSSDAFAAMAPHLEFFWKRLTRPLRAV